MNRCLHGAACMQSAPSPISTPALIRKSPEKSSSFSSRTFHRLAWPQGACYVDGHLAAGLQVASGCAPVVQPASECPMAAPWPCQSACVITPLVDFKHILFYYINFKRNPKACARVWLKPDERHKYKHRYSGKSHTDVMAEVVNLLPWSWLRNCGSVNFLLV